MLKVSDRSEALDDRRRPHRAGVIDQQPLEGINLDVFKVRRRRPRQLGALRQRKQRVLA